MPPKPGDESAGLDPAALVGLLAEQDRLKAVAALALGAATLEEVAERAALDPRRAAAALERLAGGGLVEPVGRGGLRLASERFKEAARLHAQRRAAAAPEESFSGAAPEAAGILRNFVSEGRLRQLPAARSKRLVVLDWLAKRFEPGVTYPERDVNLLLGRAHADVAAMRRHLVDEGFLERRSGFYWRAGGTFEVD